MKHSPTNAFSLAAVAVAWTLLAPGARAQGGGDSQQRIREIVQQVADEMKEIDRLLLQPGTAEARQAMERNARRMDELLQQSAKAQGHVVQGIDELIRQIESLPPSGSGGQSDDQQQSDPNQRPDRQPGRQQQPSQPRERNSTPDMVRQSEQQQQQQGQQGQQRQPGQPQGQRPQGDPRSPQDDRSKGAQTPATQPPPADGAEHAEHGTDTARWGTLPKYLQSVQNRGGLPEVPEKYRKLYEAYTKQGAKRSSSAGSGTSNGNERR